MSKELMLRRLGVGLRLIAALVCLGQPVMAGTPVQGGSLRAALTASPPTLDPHSATHLAVREAWRVRSASATPRLPRKMSRQ